MEGPDKVLVRTPISLLVKNTNKGGGCIATKGLLVDLDGSGRAGDVELCLYLSLGS